MNLEKSGETSYNKEINNNERCVLEQLREIRIRNPKKVTMGHLNINSIPNKFEGIMGIAEKNLEIFLISETKIDDSFPNTQFFMMDTQNHTGKTENWEQVVYSYM